MQNQEAVVLNRDVDATLVPAGTPIVLPEGTEVFITQELGTTFTVNIYGNLARIDGNDADALGKNQKTDELIPELLNFDGVITKDIVLAQLRTCYDPEIPVNIVDLGLVYEVSVEKHDKEDYDVNISMTLTAPGCGFGPYLVQDVEVKTKALPNINSVKVDLTFDPPWTYDMMSEEAKLRLNMF